MTAATITVLGVVALVALTTVVMYNRFVQQTNLVEESWKQVDVELQRRFDLIPNLVQTVKGYAKHEQETLTRVTEARQAAVAHAGDGPAARQPFESALGGALRGVLAVAEGYPDLKASTNYLRLQDELANTEDRIAAGRRFYNGNVRALNTRVASVPSNLVARMFGFTKKEYFEIDDDPDVRRGVRVEF